MKTKLESSLILLRLFVVFVSIWLLLIIGCGTDTTVDPTQAENLAHATRITLDQTWKANQVHVVTKEIIIDNATLTIESGTTVKFSENAGLKVLNDGGLIAQGTSTKPIIFTGSEAVKGHWNALHFDSDCNHEQCKLIHVIVEYGGGADSNGSQVICKSASPTISHCQIRNSASNGVLITGANSPIDFSYNTVTMNDRAPIIISAQLISNISENCDFTGNGADIIMISDDCDIQCSARWRKFNVPYQVTKNIRISKSTLKIDPGTEIKFAAATGIEVDHGGGLWAVGNAVETITFTSPVKQKGYWESISFFDAARDDSCRLVSCILEYGGGNPQRPGLIYCEYASPEISNCKIANSVGYGIVFVGNSHPLSFSGNIITQNEKAPIRIPADHVSAIFPGDYLGNVEDYIEILGGDIFADCVWQNPGIKYRLMSSLNIMNGTLMLQPGIVIEMSSKTSISVKMGGALQADGASNRITITGNVPQAGYWDYIHFSGDCNDVSCLLNHCTISYGGGNDGWPGSIYCENSSPSITNCRVENSATWGIFLSGDGQPDLEGTTFSGNVRGDIWP